MHSSWLLEVSTVLLDEANGGAGHGTLGVPSHETPFEAGLDYRFRDRNSAASTVSSRWFTTVIWFRTIPFATG